MILRSPIQEIRNKWNKTNKEIMKWEMTKTKIL